MTKNSIFNPEEPRAWIWYRRNPNNYMKLHAKFDQTVWAVFDNSQNGKTVNNSTLKKFFRVLKSKTSKIYEIRGQIDFPELGVKFYRLLREA